MNTKLLLPICLVALIGGCAEFETKPSPAPAKPVAAASPELDAAIAKAELDIAAAKKVNNLWSKTESFLEEAKQAKADGKADEAMKLAKKASKEADLAQKQAVIEADAKPFFPK